MSQVSRVTYPPEDAPTHLIVPAGLRRGRPCIRSFVHLGDGGATKATDAATTRALVTLLRSEAAQDVLKRKGIQSLSAQPPFPNVNHGPRRC
jgi:hypothetical protein